MAAGARTFLLVGGREQPMEEAALEPKALGECELVRRVHRLLAREHGHAPLGCDQLRHVDRLLHHHALALAHDARHQAPLLRFLRPRTS